MRSRRSAILFATGLGLVGVGFALLYLDYRVREGQWIHTMVRAEQGQEIREGDFMLWREHRHLWSLTLFWGLGLALTAWGAVEHFMPTARVDDTMGSLPRGRPSP